ncbi:MAG TPA: EAL domain-containing protein [Acidothermaceae bacterium]|jgi:diguanylate cyclase (GGDEF)-like protein/PAS domain S-box-containing protein
MAVPHPRLPPASDVGSADREELQRLHLAQKISRVGSWNYDFIAPALTVSDVLLELYGLDRSAFCGLYEVLNNCVHPDNRASVVEATQRLTETGVPMTIRYPVIRANDGAMRWLDAQGVVERDANGIVTQMAGTVADVTELVEAEIKAYDAHAELSRALSHQQAVIAATPDAIHLYDVATKQLSRANRSGKPLIGFTPEVVKVLGGHDLYELMPDQDVLDLERAYGQANDLPDGEVVSLRHRVRHYDGEIRWLSRRLTPFARNESDDVTSILVVSRDVTDVVAVEERLQRAALHDELTGLPNRRLLHDRLEHALRRTARGGHIAVLICDLDGFKRINDNYGHAVGDDVLNLAAQRLIFATRADDTVARIGGDEFAIILDIPEHLEPLALAESVGARIASLIAEPIQAGGLDHTLSVSIGIRIADDTATADTLLSDADAAMYHIKAHGGNGHRFFEIAHRPDTAMHGRLERTIRRALANDSIEVFYQPIVNPMTNGVYGIEALLRLRDEAGGFVDTAQVIAVAERTGLITALDERVLQVACAQAVVWRRDADLAHLVLNVNRSARDIAKPGFYQRIDDALTESGLDPHGLTIEITETVLLDATASDLADLRDLKERGVGLALDDFGTGYASLRYLAELPITCIKIDRSFTSRLPADPTAMTLVRATVGLAEQLAISCVVEGVETDEQRHALPDYERLLIQGYLYARPASATQRPAANLAALDPASLLRAAEISR